MKHKLQFYNSLTRKKQLFKTIKPNHVNLYVCGVTVYDVCHIGHGRVAVIFDAMVKFLKKLGYKVNYVRNITDVDDKIIKRAKDNKLDEYKLLTEMIRSMSLDYDQLGNSKPNFEPRVTKEIPEIIAMIEQLIASGHAYKTELGNVYFKIASFKEYGKLSGRKIDEMISGTRKNIEPDKQHNLDFVLWKYDSNSNLRWQSPWGEGRPGWHIECSAMAKAYCGNKIDIHGGGADLKFPHHENEIAQSEAANNINFANYWLHVGLLQINGEKMSKSLNNFITIQDALKDYSKEELRYFYLSASYRSPLNFDHNRMEQVTNSLYKLVSVFKKKTNGSLQVDLITENLENDLVNSLLDDFNTPKALRVIFNWINHINSLTKQAEINYNLVKLENWLDCFGIMKNDLNDMNEKKKIDNSCYSVTEIEDLIEQRNKARKNKNWIEADKIRYKLTKNNIILKDNQEGKTIWEYKK